MKFVIDTNIILSALIKNSITRKIIVESGWNFYYPEMSFHEIRRYKELVLKKSGMNENGYNKLLDLLLEHVDIIPDERICNYLDKAKKIMLKIDPDDVVFVAAKFSITDSVIWSDDSDFDKQNDILVLKSNKVVKLFESISK